MEKINLQTTLDIQPIIDLIDKLNDLGGDALFDGLSEIVIEKAKLKDALEVVESAERNVKAAINAKAKTLYGDNWDAIKGNRYKITRSATGAIYEVLDPEVAKPYVKVEVKPNSELIEQFQLENNALPEGIAINPERGEQIRITVKA